MKTPISAVGNESCRGCSRAAGFTLVEVLAVLVVLTLAASLIAPRLGKASNRPSVAGLAAATASLARATRDAAISSGRPAVLRFDATRRALAGEGVRARPVAVPANFDIDVQSSLAEANAAGAGIRFFANGASSGGRIRFAHGRLAYDVRVDWFTGRVRVVPLS